VRVSILIPCYNAARWIRQCIESALAQDGADREVIVVDDGSSDGSASIIREFAGRIRWESGPNRGSNPTRNRLLELATGEWLQYLDADDYLLPAKISSQLQQSPAPEADVLYGPVTLEHWTEQGSRLELLPIPEPHDPWVLLARWFLPQTGAALWRRRTLIEVGGWKQDQPACQEHELYLRLLMAGKSLVYGAAGGAVYRQWSEGTLWKRDRPQTRRLRAEILQRCEDHLRTGGLLTAERLWAINQARFESARSAWQSDHTEARTLVETIHRSQPGFIPAGDAAPPAYRVLFRWLGFSPTERLADLRRWVR